jgi:hypothetical protein
MARPTDEFVAAWSALSGASEKSGWRSISVAFAGPCKVMAGRRFPGNEEALLAGFSTAKVPPAEKLPESRGFEVSRADPHGDGKTWIALTRKESGSVELFAEMVGDIAGVIDAASGDGEDKILRALLGRIRSWQEFMGRGVQALGTEAEIGLIGELTILDAMLDVGFPSVFALTAWIGPLDGKQDFEIGHGAVEVKSTLATSGFPAKIGSLQQLDNSIRTPLFVAGVRLTQSESGRSLPDIVTSLRARMNEDAEAKRVFGDRLLSAGFFDSHADRYPRRFSVNNSRVIEVGEGFPRIIPATVPGGVRHATYEIDLDRAPGVDVGVLGAMKILGAI